MLRLLLFITSWLLLSSQLALGASANCDRDCLIDTVNHYVAALVAHDPSQAKAIASDVRITQNGEPIPLGQGVWQTITEQGGYRQVYVDSQLDSAVFFGAFQEQEKPMLLAIRFAFADGKITELEHLVSRLDERNRLIRHHKLTEANPVYEQVLPEAQRNSRSELIAAAHAYFDGLQNSTDEGVPMHRECTRRENGVLLLQNPNPETDPCPIGFHRFNYITDVRDRRIAVVDEARGLVLGWAFFDIPGNVEVEPGPWGPSDLPSSDEPRVDSRKVPRSLYIAELFRVVDGEIQDIEAIMYNLDLGATADW